MDAEGHGRPGEGHGRPRRRGRKPGSRPGSAASRDAILDAAIEVFSRRGYDAGSVRSIAAAAGVDPALVRHYFGDKESLLIAAIATRTSLASRMAGVFETFAAFDGGEEGELGTRIAREYFAVWEDEELQPVLIALVRSSMGSAEALARLRGMVVDAMYAQVDAAGLPAQRVAAAMSQLLGVALARYVVQMPQLAQMDGDGLAEMAGPGIQTLLEDGEAGHGRPSSTGQSSGGQSSAGRAAAP